MISHTIKHSITCHTHFSDKRGGVVRSGVGGRKLERVIIVHFQSH